MHSLQSSTYAATVATAVFGYFICIATSLVFSQYTHVLLNMNIPHLLLRIIKFWPQTSSDLSQTFEVSLSEPHINVIYIRCNGHIPYILF